MTMWKVVGRKRIYCHGWVVSMARDDVLDPLVASNGVSVIFGARGYVVRPSNLFRMDKGMTYDILFWRQKNSEKNNKNKIAGELYKLERENERTRVHVFRRVR
jgi:hypothetical protein